MERLETYEQTISGPNIALRASRFFRGDQQGKLSFVPDILEIEKNGAAQLRTLDLESGDLTYVTEVLYGPRPPQADAK